MLSLTAFFTRCGKREPRTYNHKAIETPGRRCKQNERATRTGSGRFQELVAHSDRKNTKRSSPVPPGSGLSLSCPIASTGIAPDSGRNRNPRLATDSQPQRCGPAMKGARPEQLQDLGIYVWCLRPDSNQHVLVQFELCLQR